MGEESKFQQKWSFRKRDNSDLESSNEDSDSHSSFKPVLKRHKLVAEGNTKTSTFDPVLALNDLKMFMRSLLDDLKGTRENLSSWMKDEMHKLVEEGNAEAQKQTRVKAKRPIKSKKDDTTDQNHQQQVHNCNGHGDLDHVARSINVLTEPCSENNKLDMSSYNYMQPERVNNTMLDASACHQYFNIAPMGSRSITQGMMESGFGNPSQVGLDNHSRDVLGLRLNGGIMNHTLPRQNFFPNNFNTHFNYRVDSGFSSLQAPSFKAPPK